MKFAATFFAYCAAGISGFTIGYSGTKPAVLLKMAYVPDGMSPKEWAKIKDKEKEAMSKKRFSAIGPQSFKSRSLQSFQEDMEKGKTGHLMPVMFAKDRVKKGELKQEDIPYMQRLGSWDNSDVKGAKKREWNKTDQKYEKGAGHFATMTDKNAGFDWTGKRTRRGPQSRGSEASKKVQDNPKKKNMFGGLWP